MGREIRRIKKGWQHPKGDSSSGYHPMYDEGYGEAMAEWIKNHELWLKGKHPDQKKEKDMEQYKFYAEWAGNAPDVEYYRPDWTEDEMTEYALYENVSEGSPISPAFHTKKKLVDWLSKYPDWWGNQWTREQAEAMVKSEYTPSFVMSGGKLYNAQEATTLKDK